MDPRYLQIVPRQELEGRTSRPAPLGGRREEWLEKVEFGMSYLRARARSRGRDRSIGRIRATSSLPHH